MSSDFNGDVSVEILLDNPQIEQVSFGLLLIAAASTSLGVGFTERVRSYASAAEAAADTALSSGLKAAVAAVFTQTLKPAAVKVGRLDPLVAQVSTLTITAPGAEGDAWAVELLDQTATYTVGVGNGVNDVATGLAAALDALEGVTAAAVAAVITITGDNPGQAFEVSVEDPATSGTFTQANPTPAVTVADGLASIAAEDNAWYGLHLESRAARDILAAAAWVEVNEKLQVAQSSDADLLTSDTSDIASRLKALGYRQTALLYYATGTTWAALAWATNRLSVDPDTRTTTWNKVTLVGVTTSSLTTTQKGYALAKNANLYLPFFSGGATGDGKCANGTFIDLALTADWIRARVREEIAALMLRYSNAGQKVPFTNAGIGVFGAAVLKVLARGEAANHFVEGTGQVNLPKLKAVAPSERAGRGITFTFGAEPAGAIHKATLTGYITLDLALIA